MLSVNVRFWFARGHHVGDPCYKDRSGGWGTMGTQGQSGKEKLSVQEEQQGGLEMQNNKN